MYYDFIIQISCYKDDGEVEQGFFTQIMTENSVGRRGASNPYAGISIPALLHALRRLPSPVVGTWGNATD